MKSHIKLTIKLLLWLAGGAFWIVWIFLYWNDPVLISTKGELVYPNGPVEIWLVRSLYVAVFVIACYREWAEATEGDFPPYNPFALLFLFWGYFVLVYAAIK